jgi:hypothetical protein
MVASEPIVTARAGGDGIGAQALVGIGRHDLHRHADRTEAEEAGGPEPPVRHGSGALDVSIRIALEHIVKPANQPL